MDLVRSAWAENPEGRDPAPEETLAVETQQETKNNPFDGVVTNNSKALQHVYSAYGISLAILLAYALVVSFRLARYRTGRES
ncbi:MAG: hypothetical protein VX498_03885 [Myxococcota bacterium]|nr:hypothetical protein [Myxococcota bacterium]